MQLESLTNLGVKTFFLGLFGVRVLITIEPENLRALMVSQFNDFAFDFRDAQLYLLWMAKDGEVY